MGMCDTHHDVRTRRAGEGGKEAEAQGSAQAEGRRSGQQQSERGAHQGAQQVRQHRRGSSRRDGSRLFVGVVLIRRIAEVPPENRPITTTRDLAEALEKWVPPAGTYEAWALDREEPAGRFVTRDSNSTYHPSCSV